MIGTRSIVLNLKVTNNKNAQSPYEVKVQANKNYGFCDVVLPGTPIKPEKTYINFQKEARKKEKELYDIKKAEYDKEILKRKTIRNILFNNFQGKQLNDYVIVERLKNVLHDTLNTVEL